jgi:hypothetical protein
LLVESVTLERWIWRLWRFVLSCIVRSVMCLYELGKYLKCHCQHHVKKFLIWFHSFYVTKHYINWNVVFKQLKCNENLYKNISNVTNIITNDSSLLLLCPAMYYLTSISNFCQGVNLYSWIYVNNCVQQNQCTAKIIPQW